MEKFTNFQVYGDDLLLTTFLIPITKSFHGLQIYQFVRYFN